MTFKATFAVLLISITGLAFAGASSCYSISNRDSKNFCLAQAKQEKSYCYSIGDRDQKNFCLAVVSKQKSYCYNISSRDDKNACLARF
jgi:hypothetical protein